MDLPYSFRMSACGPIFFISQDSENQQSTTLPGLAAVVPQITADQLKAPQMKLVDDLPHMILQSATWLSTPVTVKRFKGEEVRKKLMMKEADLLR